MINDPQLQKTWLSKNDGKAALFESWNLACLSAVGSVLSHVSESEHGAHGFPGWIDVRA
jgi:hypothetical protein